LLTSAVSHKTYVIDTAAEAVSRLLWYIIVPSATGCVPPLATTGHSTFTVSNGVFSGRIPGRICLAAFAQGLLLLLLVAGKCHRHVEAADKQTYFEDYRLSLFQRISNVFTCTVGP